MPHHQTATSANCLCPASLVSIARQVLILMDRNFFGIPACFVASEGERSVFEPYALNTRPARLAEHVQTALRSMPLDGLFAMKTYAIQRRHRSRDVLDLWHFVRAGRTISEIVAESQRVSTTATAERAISVLRGDWPLDVQDEGFRSLSPVTTLERIRSDFCAWTDVYAQERARAAARSHN